MNSPNIWSVFAVCLKKIIVLISKTEWNCAFPRHVLSRAVHQDNMQNTVEPLNND